MGTVVLVVDSVRSTHNVGSFFRTADSLGVSKMFLCGITPYPMHRNDDRLPYLAAKIDAQIAKTALGAEKSVTWEYEDSIQNVLMKLIEEGYEVLALEQVPKAVRLDQVRVKDKVAIIVGNEISGVSQAALDLSHQITEIPMSGQKESLNVSVAAGIALFYLRDIAYNKH